MQSNQDNGSTAYQSIYKDSLVNFIISIQLKEQRYNSPLSLMAFETLSKLNIASLKFCWIFKFSNHCIVCRCYIRVVVTA